MKRLAVLAAVFAAVVLAAPASAAPTHYVKMSDGASIAINVKVPPHCLVSKCPTYFEMSGYESGSDEGKTPAGHLADQTGLPFPLQTGTREAHASKFEDRYVTVLASVRGTGCSSGEFDLFSLRSALDGKEVIDKWIAKQPWSNGDVAIFGHSYSGITGAFVASTRPEHLKAVSISGLIGDLYRDITYPGGVTNYGFPLLWTGAIRVAYDVGGGTLGGLYPVEDTSAQCAANQAERRRALPRGPADPRPRRHRRQLVPVALARQLRRPHQRPGARHVRLPGRADRPARPDVRVRQALEQRSRSGSCSSTACTAPTPTTDLFKDRAAWLDYWMLNKELRGPRHARRGTVRPRLRSSGRRPRPTKTSRVILGYQGGGKAVGEVRSNGFPLGQTQFTDLYATDGNKLVWQEDAVEPGSSTWMNGSHRQAYSYQAGVNTGGEVSSPTGPDEVELSSFPFNQPTAIAGPIMAHLYVSRRSPGHRAVRAAAGPRARRDAALPQPRHAAREPPSDRRGGVAEDRRRSDLPPVPAARARRGRAVGRGDGLPDRRVPGRTRVPARATSS